MFLLLLLVKCVLGTVCLLVVAEMPAYWSGLIILCLVLTVDNQFSLDTNTRLVDGITFTVGLIFQNSSFTTSNISFTASAAADGKVLACTGAGVTSKKNLRIVTSGMSL